MLVRPMNKKDLTHVIEIERRIFSLPWNIEDFESAITNPANTYLVAEEDGKIIAYCGLWGIINEGHINNVAVVPEYRGRGIAYRMLSELIGLGKMRKISNFTLEVRLNNKKAIDLYRRLGFENVGIRPNFYKLPKDDAVIMWLETSSL